MTFRITRRGFAAGAGAVALIAGGFGRDARAVSDNTTLRLIMRNDLRVLDPLWTTAYASRDHGYMIYDTLFALDSKLKPHPQMVGDYGISSDKLIYTFALRAGLKFHDGQPVLAADCIASLRRWMARDSLGQSLAAVIDTMTADGTKFTIKLKEPFPLLLNGLAKVSSLVPFIMPERIARTDKFKQITETIGSGPFKFVHDEFQPGHKAVYVKNADYIPRREPPSWASGGKIARVDRIEFLYMPEASTAAAALDDDEVDWWVAPPLDLVPVLAANPDIDVKKTDPLGSTTMLRFNQLQPPFDNVKMRQAVLAVADQTAFMTALAGDQKNWRLCPSFFTCGTPMSNEAGSSALTGKRDFDKAKRLVAEAGYNGEKVVVLDAVDTLTAHAHALVAFDLLKKLGLNAEIDSSDWGTLVIRRASKKPVDQGGWSIFGTGWTGIETLDPSADLPLATNGGTAWFGWPKDDQLEKLRAEWVKTDDGELRQDIAVKIQQRAFETLPYIPTGQWYPVTAYRKSVKGVIIGPALFLWNVEKG